MQNNEKQSIIQKMDKRLYIVLVSLVITAVFFIFAESVLRLGDFRYEPWELKSDIFIKDEKTGEMITNPEYAGRHVYSQRFKAKKAKDVLRVIMIGASNILPLDDAEPLHQKLSSLLGVDKEKIEIINMGFLACGSDRMVISTREAVKYDPDVVMIYSGHSEFISFSKPENLNWHTKFALHSRLIQLLVKKIMKNLNRENNFFFLAYMRDYNRVDREYIFEEYRENLSEIIETIVKHKAVPVIGTLAFNRHSIDIPESPDKSDVLRRIAKPEIHGDVLSFDAEGIINSADEENRFASIAMQLFDAERYEESKLFYDLSLEAQSAPSNATRINNRIVRNLSKKYSVELTDMSQIMDSMSVKGFSGYEYFWDNCHLNKQGQNILMLSFAESIQKALSRKTRN